MIASRTIHVCFPTVSSTSSCLSVVADKIMSECCLFNFSCIVTTFTITSNVSVPTGLSTSSRFCIVSFFFVAKCINESLMIDCFATVGTLLTCGKTASGTCRCNRGNYLCIGVLARQLSNISAYITILIVIIIIGVRYNGNIVCFLNYNITN